MDDVVSVVGAASELVRSRMGGGFDVLVVAGSGWGVAGDVLGVPEVALPFAQVPGCAAPSVAGHGGELRALTVGSSRVLLSLGRTHLYEGRGVDAVVHMVRVAAELGCGQVVLTNGCGSVHPQVVPGTPVLLADHLNLTGASPLSGPTFVDLSEVYSSRLRGVARLVDPSLGEGVYAAFRGPQYETPAEVRMARTLGADLVGMSTVLEAIECRRLGLEVLGVSLVTNLAAGVSSAPLDHSEVLQAGRDAAPRLGGLLRGFLERL